MTPRSKPRQWRMNSPSRWPLDPRRQQAPRPRPGRFAGRRTPHDPHPHQPPTHGGDLRPWHGTRPPLARRWRRAWLPSALRLDGLRRPDRHSPHHGPRLAVCRVVDCRNEGITTISPAPTPFRPGRGRRKIRARRWPRPVSRPKARTPLRRLRAGGEGRRTSGLVREKPAKPNRASAHSADDMPNAPRRKERDLWGYAPACCGRLHESVPSSTLAVRRLYVTKDGSPTHRPTLYGASTPPLTQEAACYVKGACALVSGVVLARVRAQAGEAVTRGCRVGHVSIRERAASTSLCCCESWRWHGCALGFMAATFQRKQFPRLCHCVRRLPRATNSFRFQALHCVAPASGAARPSPA